MLFDAPEREWPPWYRPSKHRPKHNSRVVHGLHPTGQPLGPEDKRCRDCAHHYASRWSREYPRCRLEDAPPNRAPHTMRGEVPGRWRACARFEEEK